MPALTYSASVLGSVVVLEPAPLEFDRSDIRAWRPSP